MPGAGVRRRRRIVVGGRVVVLRRVHSVEVREVKQVERLSDNRELVAFLDLELPSYTEIDVGQARTLEGVPDFVVDSRPVQCSTRIVDRASRQTSGDSAGGRVRSTDRSRNRLFRVDQDSPSGIP